MPNNWYWPNSAGSEELLHEIAGKCASDFPEFLLRLSRTASGKPAQRDILVLDNFKLSEKQARLATSLEKVFNHFGSDKANVHNYHLLYGAILAYYDNLSILEIGLGSNDTEIASNMSEEGKPGASMRAFRKIYPKATIHGADIDKKIKVEKEKVFFVDQTDPASFDTLRKEGAIQYQLIIDDGLHVASANLATLEFALSKMAPDGVIVIEDIAENALDVWELVQTLLSPYYHTALVATKSAYVFIVTPISSSLLRNLY